jgi:DNA-binding transcriptional regulator YhcF (GntR family)
MKILKDDVKYGGKNHYDMVHSWITHDFNITSDAFRLYVILCNALINSRIDKKNFCPTTKVLASMFGVKIRAIEKYLWELKTLGYISIDRKSDSNDYIITVHPKPKDDTYKNGLKTIKVKKEEIRQHRIKRVSLKTSEADVKKDITLLI